MYTPKHNREEDREKLYAFMRAHSFAALVTVKDHVPRATHLPFMVDMKDERITLYAHMAKANDQWRDFSATQELLVIFQEPHAYVSPRHYETAHNVPTWNYVAVHLYGHARVLETDAEKLELLERMIAEHDADYLRKWKEMPKDYINSKLNGIVAFRVDPTRVEARFKLSQDRTRRERENIINEFASSRDSVVSELVDLMKERL
ncbi:MAG: FMN-binding negative transcriptional regulator [Pyrinomonadaceae bacterium]|nr:FMN-binding negative transcriptional regulator [Pyrinomonadaceae bacterium]